MLFLASPYISSIYVLQGLQHLLDFSQVGGVDIFTDERSKTLSLIRLFRFISIQLKGNCNEIRFRGSGANNNARDLDVNESEPAVLATLAVLRHSGPLPVQHKE